MLPEIVDAVAGAVEVYVDGGIRRGTDVLKAIACGARAVLIGRPILWGLTVGGEAGVKSVLEMLRQEFDLAHDAVGLPEARLRYQRSCPALVGSGILKHHLDKERTPKRYSGAES
jgi:hypothetical protein